MSQLTIRAKLSICLGLFAIAFGALIATMQLNLHASKAAFETLLVDRIKPMRDLKIAVDAYAVAIGDASHKARNGNLDWHDAARQVADGRQKIDRHWKTYSATRIEGREAALKAIVEQKMIVADAEVAALQTILRRSDRRALDDFVVRRLYPAIDPVSSAISDLVDEQLAIATAVTGEAERAGTTAQIVSLAIGLVVAGVWLFAFVVSRRSISRPINHLADTMDTLAGTPGDIAIPYQTQSDEIGRMARACEVFRAAAVERTQAEERAAVTQRQVTGDLRTAIGAVAGGDLTRTLVAPFPGEYEPVHHDFNAALSICAS